MTISLTVTLSLVNGSQVASQVIVITTSAFNSQFKCVFQAKSQTEWTRTRLPFWGQKENSPSICPCCPLLWRGGGLGVQQGDFGFRVRFTCTRLQHHAGSELHVQAVSVAGMQQQAVCCVPVLGTATTPYELLWKTRQKPCMSACTWTANLTPVFLSDQQPCSGLLPTKPGYSAPCCGCLAFLPGHLQTDSQTHALALFNLETFAVREESAIVCAYLFS